MKKAMGFLMCLGIVMIISSNVHSEESNRKQFERDAISGLKGIKIAVSMNPPVGNMNADDIKRNIELKLMKSGIKVYTEGDQPIEGEPTLLFAINVSEGILGEGNGVVAAYLYEDVILYRNKSKVTKAVVWRDGFVSQGYKDKVLKTIDKLVDRFTYDYLSVNMK